MAPDIQDMSAKKRAVVIGAGAGGIATAARLARAGLHVTVLEKNDFTGGRCSLIRTDGGYRFDQGPSLLLLPDIFRETFVDLGSALEDHVELLRCNPNYHVFFPDGEVVRTSTDIQAMQGEIERFEGPEGFSRYLRWLAEAQHHYAVSVEHVLRRDFSSLIKMAVPALCSVHPLESIWLRARRYFWTERLRRLFTFATMYMGMSPFDAPATYSLLQFTELVEGVWYPRGGFHVVLEALVKLGEKAGVEYRLSCPVQTVTVSPDGKKATGVRLETGEVVPADVVVCNADLVYAYGNLLPQTERIQKYTRSLRKRDTSCSSVSFYWSLKTKAPQQLGAHNIFLTDEYRESFDSIFKRFSLPDQPSFYMHVPSRVDQSAAPEGCDAVIALVPVGHITEDEKGNAIGNQDWPTLISKARTAVLNTLDARLNRSNSSSHSPQATDAAPLLKKTHTPFRDLIADEILNTPHSWRERFHLDRGAILGLSHDFFNVLWFRPGAHAKEPKGVYFVGASTHPGTGVPIVLAGAKLTSEHVLKDLGMSIPWTNAASKIRNGSQPGLDRIERPPVWQLLNLDLSVLIVLGSVFGVSLAGIMLWSCVSVGLQLWGLNSLS